MLKWTETLRTSLLRLRSSGVSRHARSEPHIAMDDSRPDCLTLCIDTETGCLQPRCLCIHCRVCKLVSRARRPHQTNRSWTGHRQADIHAIDDGRGNIVARFNDGMSIPRTYFFPILSVIENFALRDIGFLLLKSDGLDCTDLVSFAANLVARDGDSDPHAGSKQYVEIDIDINVAFVGRRCPANSFGGLQSQGCWVFVRAHFWSCL